MKNIRQLSAVVLLVVVSVVCGAQTLQIALTPGTISSYAGTGTSGAPTSGPATSSEIDQPLSVAVDSSGNLYISETDSYINLVTFSTGYISTIAGNGTSGYVADGVSAATAEVNVARGLAVDSNDDVFISDSGNNRVRIIYNGGTAAKAILSAEGVSSPTIGYIYTIAGNGNTTGGSASGTQGKSQNINSPRGLYIDTTGDLYITDQYYVRILYAGGANAKTLIAEETTYSSPSIGYMYTVGGSGSTTYNGENVKATSAGMNPTSVALDGSGNVYIGDQGTARVQKITLSGTNAGKISTIAGNGTAGGTGDGGAASSAEVNTVRGIAVDGGGNLYLADTLNNCIRKVDGSGKINTIAGTNSTTGGYIGDLGNATAAKVNQPYDVSLDSTGNLYIADMLNNRVRKVTISTASFSYASTALGSTSAGQNAIISNVGSSTLTLSGITIPAGFKQTASGGTDCSSTTSLNSSLSCNVQLSFSPAMVGSNSGTATVSSSGGSVNVALSGNGLVAATTTTLTASANPINPGQSVTLTATVGSPGIAPTGSVIFYNGGVYLATATISSGTASFTSNTVVAGSNSITAAYSGDTNNAPSTSSALVLVSNGGSSTTTGLVSSPTSATYGTAVTLTASVSTGGSNQPTGMVTFAGNGVSLGSATLTSGVATFSTVLPRGINSYVASYSGDIYNIPSTSSAISVTIVEPVAYLTGNNTAACPASGTLPAYCQQAYTGQSDTRSGVETVNYDPVAGNVSDEDVHGYLTDGSATKILANFMIGYCTSPSTLNTTTNVQNCDGNVLTGYTSNDSNTVAAQAQDLARRHIDGAVLTWSAGGSSEDATALKLQMYIDNSNLCSGSQCIVSYVNQLNETLQYPTASVWTANGLPQIPGCVYGQAPTNTDALYESCVLAELENDMCYLNAAHFGNKAYLKASGQPILQVFQYETQNAFPATGAPSWQDVWNNIEIWNSSLSTNCSAAIYKNLTYNVNNGTPLLVFVGQTGLSHPDTSGAFYWVEPDTGAPINQNIYNITSAAESSTTATLDYFFQQTTTTYSSLPQIWGGAFKGFNDIQSAWGNNRMIDQQCGMTWIESLTEGNKYYTGSALPYIEIATWNDYNEGTPIEMGINNCYTVSASVAGSMLTWSLNPAAGTTPNVATVSHLEIYDSPDGINFTLLTSQAAATSGSYSLSTLPSGSHQLYVYMVGKNSILNQISSNVAYSN